VTVPSPFEQEFAAWLDADAASPAPAEVLAGALERVADTGQERYFSQRLFGDRIGRSPAVRWALVLVLLAVALAGSAAIAGGRLTSPAPPLHGAFQPGPSLLIGRGFHTTTLLADGRILVVGGRTHPDSWVSVTESTEVWDPAAGDDTSFVRGGPLLEGRSGHTATLLPDGRVLIVGGLWWDGDETVRSSAEIRDPEAGTFSPAGQLSVPRSDHTATLLPDGRVLIAGGDEAGTAEVWDPRTSTFIPTGEMTSPHSRHTALGLGDGRVLIVGDTDTELWDSATGGFTQGPALAEPRYFHTVTLLRDGRVLVTGGMWGSDADIVVRSSAEIWDPAAGSFALVGEMAVPRASHSASLLQDGRILVTGGDEGGTAEVWDPSTGAFAATGQPIESRHNATATLLPDGRVLILGAMSRSPIPRQTQIWNPLGQPVRSAGPDGSTPATGAPSDPNFIPTAPPRRSVGG
jgi:WD40 repeat protein